VVTSGIGKERMMAAHKTTYAEWGAEQLREELDVLRDRYEDFRRQELTLTMARGKPAPAQLDLSAPLLDAPLCDTFPFDSEGDDTRNYGKLFGIPEARELMAQILGVPAAQVLVSGNSSLALMYGTVAHAMLCGTDGFKPWSRLRDVKFLCPSPGYDRHFALTESFGIKNVEIPMTPQGPDMDVVERLVQTDSAVKGIWCVPKYSNPQGITYSDEVVQRFAQLRPAAGDFRIFWDNAYAVHDLFEPGDPLLNLSAACERANNPNIYHMFASTSKITFASGGISAQASSPDNLAEIAQYLTLQNIGPDKVNQARHVAFLRDLDGIREHMRRHAAIIAPKFAVVLDTFERELGNLDIARWTNPRGGYFISFDGPVGTAKRTVELAREAGVILTDAGATFPYHTDYRDANIRIAPTYPSVDELRIASELFCVCVRMAAIERLLGEVLVQQALL
jgi:aspartate/methionine/tyrosine aminotransferase